MSVPSLFLSYSVDKLRQFTDRIETCFSRLTDDQIWSRGHENENAMGNLVLHLAGNVRQWIIVPFGQQNDSRDRDSEFAARGGYNSQELIARLRSTVEHATALISLLSAEQLSSGWQIQGYNVSGLEAVYHVVEHFAQHTAQIIYATKMMTSSDLGFYRHLKETGHNQVTP